MGQYYKPIILAEKEGEDEKILSWVYSHELGSGLKLMEHSWRKNPFVQAFETLIANNPQRVVWAGDYADDEPNRTIKWMEDSKDALGQPFEVEEESGANLYDLCEDDTKVSPKARRKEYRYIINRTQMTFVDKRKGMKDADGWQIHPLPLLTCEGNGRGGGDFRGTSSLIGIWARDVISVSDTKPQSTLYKELIFKVTE
jgi:hypothetical protein